MTAREKAIEVGRSSLVDNELAHDTPTARVLALAVIEGIESAGLRIYPADAPVIEWRQPPDHPEKPGMNPYEHVDCLIIYKGDLLLRPWNCEHCCFDDEDGDDFFCQIQDVTTWAIAPLSAPPKRAENEAS